MFSKIFAKSDRPEVDWKKLETADQLDELDVASQKKPVVIFKHSTRCSISSMSLNRFERGFEADAGFDAYFVDLIANREVSNAIEQRYGVAHESPQAILIREGQAIYDASHSGISFGELNNRAKDS